MKEKVLFVLSIVLLFPLTASSYDTSTHAALTREAYKRSAFQKAEPEKPDLLTRLGIAAYSGNLGNAYLDMTPDGTVLARHSNPSSGGVTGDADFTKTKFEDANKRLSEEEQKALPMQSPTGWLMVGAIREDDFRYDTGNNENSPQDDLYGSNKNMNRIFHHFYDPYRDIPLNGTLGTKTPEWAIEGTHRGPNIGIFSGHDNRFAIKHAREAMFRAATMRRLENGELKPLPAPDPSGFGTTGLQMGELFRVGESEELHRRAYWATVFKSLGHALHLLHDMGQPQHVRNDSHSGAGCPRITGIVDPNLCFGGQDSFYEKYLEARVAGKAFFVLTKRFFERYEDGDVRSPQISAKPLNYDGYAKIPSFNGYYDYYSSKGKTGYESYSGTGLANYTNMGFFSAGTNLGSFSLYPYPPRDYSAFVLNHILPSEVEGMNGELIDGNEEAWMTLMRYPVIDKLDPGETQSSVPLTSYSVFDKFLRDKGKDPVYALNHYNYDAQADLLLPRAVSYSAGLIDYFFRGNMEISLPKEGIYGLVDHAKFAPPNKTDAEKGFKGFGKIKLKLKNTTENIEAPGGTYPQTMSNGILVAVLKFYRNTEYTDDLDGELSLDATQADIDRKKSKEEEIVVSDPVPLASLAFGEETELTFNFPDELPINAWAPVRLSVVFRGKLGDEEDAVVIAAEKPLSSPLFITVASEQDYLAIATQCYSYEYLQNNASSREAAYSWLIPECQGARWPVFEIRESCKGGGNVPMFLYIGQPSPAFVAWNDGEGVPVRSIGRVAFLMGDETVRVTAYVGTIARQFVYENRGDDIPRFITHRGIKMSNGLSAGFRASNYYLTSFHTTCVWYSEEPLPLDKYPQPARGGW